ncbi:MAG TPA: glycosyl hydrolase family 28 protein, partial [Puia sp.]|nr:glycosyl hydrolase family 28 protein [Puia sp.]
ADFDRKYTRQKDLYMDPRFGRLDGPVLWKGRYEDRPGVMVIFSNCKRIHVDQVKFEESPNWTIAFLQSDDIHVNGITIGNLMSIPNSDGIDFYDSKHITVSNCFIQAGDDAIAVVSSSSMVVSNCILHSRSCGIRVGYNVFNDNDSGDLLFNNISIYDSNRGIGIFQRRKGNMKNMTFSNINIETRLHSGQWWGHGEPIHISSVPGLGNMQTGKISRIRFSNITAVSESGIVIIAASQGLIEDISFEQVDLTIKPGPLNDGYGGNIDLRPVNDISKGIFKHDIPALYTDFVSQLNIHSFTVRWEEGLPLYFKHAIECKNYDGVNVDGLREFLPVDRKDLMSETIYLHKGRKDDLGKINTSTPNKRLIRKDDLD